MRLMEYLTVVLLTLNHYFETLEGLKYFPSSLAWSSIVNVSDYSMDRSLVSYAFFNS